MKGVHFMIKSHLPSADDDAANNSSDRRVQSVEPTASRERFQRLLAAVRRSGCPLVRASR